MPRSLPWQAQFVLLALIWGASFLFIKVEVDAGIAPLHVAFLRVAMGGTALLLILAATRTALPREPRLWGHLLVVAVLMNGLPFVLFAYGETEVPSAIAGILNAATPLLVYLVSLGVLPDERATARSLAGLVVGFGGVLLVLGPWDIGGSGSLLGSLACLGAAACYGLGWPYMRRHLTGRPESPAALSAAQILCGVAILAPFIPLGTLPETTPGTDVWLSALGLGALGTGVAYIFNFEIVRQAGSQTASTVTYLVPIFATIFGVLVLSETLSWHELAGAAVILAGVALAQRE